MLCKFNSDPRFLSSFCRGGTADWKITDNEQAVDDNIHDDDDNDVFESENDLEDFENELEVKQNASSLQEGEEEDPAPVLHFGDNFTWLQDFS